MSKMFYNYDNDIDKNLSVENLKIPPVIQPLKSIPNISLLCNRKGETYGVEVKYEMPFVLYFHLEEQHGWDLANLLASSLIEFKLYTKINHKSVLEKTFVGPEVFLPKSSDLALSFFPEELENLKQESYEMSVTLKHHTGIYKLFTEQDGLLVFR